MVKAKTALLSTVAALVAGTALTLSTPFNAQAAAGPTDKIAAVLTTRAENSVVTTEHKVASIKACESVAKSASRVFDGNLPLAAGQVVFSSVVCLEDGEPKAAYTCSNGACKPVNP